jgi:hypothetical protein
MRNVVKFAAGSLLVFVAASSLAAQLGVERRVDRRLDRRADAGNPNAAARLDARATTDPNAWRMKWNNNQWWYYNPQNQWMYYDNNNWSAYNANSYLPPRTSYVYGNSNVPSSTGRYYTGYRGYWGPPAVSPTAPAPVAAPTTPAPTTPAPAAAAPAAVQPAPATVPAP